MKAVAFASELDQQGFTIVPNALLLDDDLTAQARMTWAVLAFYARESDEAWPGQERLGEHLGVGDRQMRTYLRELETTGWLATSRRGLGQSNLYRLHSPSGLDRKHTSGQAGSTLPPSSTQRSSTQKNNAPKHDPRVEEVWAYWIAARQPTRTKLDAGNAKNIARALNADFDVADLCHAIDGLLTSGWHREKGKLTLSTIFKTGPGTESFTDRIQGFIDRALSSPANSNGAGPSNVPDWVKRQLALFGERGHENRQAKSMGEDALAWLERAGLKALWSRSQPPCELTRIVRADMTDAEVAKAISEGRA